MVSEVQGARRDILFRDRRDCLVLWELLDRLAPWVLLARTAHQVRQVPPARRARPGNLVLPVNQVCRVLPDRRVRWGHTASTVLLGPRVLWDRMVCRAFLVRRELQELRAFPASLVLLVSTAFLAPPVRRVLEALRVRTERGGCRDRMARPAHLARLAPQDLRVHRARLERQEPLVHTVRVMAITVAVVVAIKRRRDGAA